MTQSEASFIIRNPHDKPLCIYTNHSAPEAVMSLSLQTSWQLKRALPNFAVLPAGDSATCIVALLHAAVAAESHPQIFSFCNAILLLADCRVSIRSVLIQSEAELDLLNEPPPDQVSVLINQFESQGRVNLIGIPLDFYDIAPPAVVCKTAPGIFSISKTSNDVLMLTNDGRIVSPLAMLRPVCSPSAVNSLTKIQPAPPEWMRPKGTLDYCEFHRNCTANTVGPLSKDGNRGIVVIRAPHTPVGPTDAPSQVSLVNPSTSPVDAKASTSGDNAPALLSSAGGRVESGAASGGAAAAVSDLDSCFESLNVSANDATPVPDLNSIVVLEISKCISSSSNGFVEEECKNWLEFMKELKRKLTKKHLNPLPAFARGISLNGRIESSGTGAQPALVVLTSEGFLQQEHMQLCSCSSAEPEGDFCIKLANTLIASATPPWSSADSTVTFKNVEHRDQCLRVMRIIIACLVNREKKASLLLNSIEMQLQSRTPAEVELSRSFLQILSPKQSPILSALDFPYEGPSPPIMPQLIRTIRALYERFPNAILEEIDHPIFSSLQNPDGASRMNSRPLHLLVRSCFDVDVPARSVYWLIRAVAHAAPAALRVKDCRTFNDHNGEEFDHGIESTLLMTLIYSKRNTSVMRDHDFETQTLRMLLQAEPSLASEPISDRQGETIFSYICGDLEDASCSFHRNAYNALQSLLQACPPLASQRIPSFRNRLPLHLLCSANPKPHELRLVVDAYPDAATIGDSDCCLPIHALVQVSSFFECVEMLTAIAPDSMSQHTRQGHYPLHMICLFDQPPPHSRFLASLIRSCRGRIVCDFAPNSCRHVLKLFKRWAVQGITCENYELVRNMDMLDISCCEDGVILKADQIVDLLSILLPHCTSLTILDISDNHFSREHIEALLPVILQLPKLQHLKLDGDACLILNKKSIPELLKHSTHRTASLKNSLFDRIYITVFLQDKFTPLQITWKMRMMPQFCFPCAHQRHIWTSVSDARLILNWRKNAL